MNENPSFRTPKHLPKDIVSALCALAAGALIAVFDFGQKTSAADSLFVLLLRPWTLLGEGLRAWSLSGAAGNAAAWAAVIVLSLLPCAYVLFARRRQKRRSDPLFPLLSAFVFLCLYLLVNPSLVTHPMLAASAGAELQRMTPALVLCCVLTACILIRWADGLAQEKPISSLLRWMNVLLLVIMLITALSAGSSLAGSLRRLAESMRPQYRGYFEAYPAVMPETADAWAQPLLSLFDPIPQLFLILTLHRASALCSAFEKHGFDVRTEECAAALAAQARHMLIALCACIALKNTCAMLMGSMLADLSVSLNVPLVETAFACGTMLLARCIAAACRIKRENDLII